MKHPTCSLRGRIIRSGDFTGFGGKAFAFQPIGDAPKRTARVGFIVGATAQLALDMRYVAFVDVVATVQSFSCCLRSENRSSAASIASGPFASTSTNLAILVKQPIIEAKYAGDAHEGRARPGIWRACSFGDDRRLSCGAGSRSKDKEQYNAASGPFDDALGKLFRRWKPPHPCGRMPEGCPTVSHSATTLSQVWMISSILRIGKFRASSASRWNVTRSTCVFQSGD